MKFVDRVKVFYLYNLRFLRNRQFIRAIKTATGIGVLTGTSYWYYTQLNAAIEEKKQRRTGRDSLIAAGVLSQVSGYGENKLAPGKSLQGESSSYRGFHTRLYHSYHWLIHVRVQHLVLGSTTLECNIWSMVEPY